MNVHKVFQTVYYIHFILKNFLAVKCSGDTIIVGKIIVSNMRRVFTLSFPLELRPIVLKDYSIYIVERFL